MEYGVAPQLLLGDPDVPVDGIFAAIVDLHRKRQKEAKHKGLREKLAARMPGRARRR